jgi:hypothetical protein
MDKECSRHRRVPGAAWKPRSRRKLSGTLCTKASLHDSFTSQRSVDRDMRSVSSTSEIGLSHSCMVKARQGVVPWRVATPLANQRLLHSPKGRTALQQPCEPNFSAVERRIPGGSFSTSKRTLLLLDKPGKGAGGTDPSVHSCTHRSKTAAKQRIQKQRSHVRSATVAYESWASHNYPQMLGAHRQQTTLNGLAAECKSARMFSTLPFAVKKQKQSKSGVFQHDKRAQGANGDALDLTPDVLCLRPRLNTGAVRFGTGNKCALPSVAPMMGTLEA